MSAHNRVASAHVVERKLLGLCRRVAYITEVVFGGILDADKQFALLEVVITVTRCNANACHCKHVLVCADLAYDAAVNQDVFAVFVEAYRFITRVCSDINRPTALYPRVYHAADHTAFGDRGVVSIKLEARGQTVFERATFHIADKSADVFASEIEVGRFLWISLGSGNAV